MRSSNKIKKEKLHIFIDQIDSFIQDLNNLIQSKVFELKIDKNVNTLV